MKNVQLDVIRDALDEFDYKCSEESGFETKLVKLVEEYNLDENDLADSIIAFAVKAKKDYIDLNFLLQLEQDLGRQKPLKERNNVSYEAFTPYVPPKGEYKHGNYDEEYGDINKYDQKYRDFAPVKSTKVHVGFLLREEPRSLVHSELKGQSFTFGRTSGKPEFKLVSACPSQLFANDKVTTLIDAKCERMSHFAALYHEANQIEDWARHVVSSDDKVFIYGEVFREGADLLNDGLVTLQLDNDQSTLIRVNVDSVPSVTLFPGQIVAFEGTFRGDLFIAGRQLSLPKLPLTPIVRSNLDTLKLVVAAGPFTNSYHLGYEPLLTLLDTIISSPEDAPHFLILQGPFVDRNNKSFTDFKMNVNTTNTDIMKELMRNVAAKLNGVRTELILQPSPTRDSSCFGVFPAPPLGLPDDAVRVLGKRVHLVPDPAVINIAGVQIGLSASEVVTHLSKSEFHKSDESTDRIARLLSHTLSQRSLYPLCPPPIPTNISDLITIAKLDSAPHMMLLPSILPPSVKSVDGSIFCNPGNLLRGKAGTYIQAEINVGRLTDPSKFADAGLFKVMRV